MNRLLCYILLAGLCPLGLIAERDARLILYDLITEKSDYSQSELLDELGNTGDPFIAEFYEQWRGGGVFLSNKSEMPLVYFRTGDSYTELRTADVTTLSDGNVDGLEKARPSRNLRKLLKPILDTLGLSAKDPSVRVDAAFKLGMGQNEEYLSILKSKLETEKDSRVKKAIEEAYLISLLGNTEDSQVVLESVQRLGELNSVRSRDIILKIAAEIDATGKDPEGISAAVKKSIISIESHETIVGFFENLSRGLSTGSVLLIVSFGLAITFGLMGIINMAHGEFIALGGYTCYVVQGIFANVFGVHSVGFQWFFIVSLPVSFLVAGGVGFLFEKSFIRFLYRRPLESLLATWGLSMVMQQSFRLWFGAANVSVETPNFLAGNYELWGIGMSYSRIFVIFLAIFIAVGTWALLTKTNLGLYIRAVMQNRSMASSIGIPVDRVNSMTFSLGCGLAAIAGAALSQIGNVGPTMGQDYIVKSFMVVVVGGVGNLLGAGVSAMGIGTIDQFLQPTLGPVMGTIIVFAGIILFLQWRPSGLFATKSRSLED